MGVFHRICEILEKREESMHSEGFVGQRGEKVSFQCGEFVQEEKIESLVISMLAAQYSYLKNMENTRKNCRS